MSRQGPTGMMIGQERVKNRSFSLVVITSPVFFDGEADCLEGLLSEGLQRLHIRKPEAGEEDIEKLLDRLPAGRYSRLVLHGSRDLADRYGIPQIHCSVNGREVQAGGKVSASFHSWKEVDEMGSGLEYAFLSPLFDSISKPGYAANRGLLQRPAGVRPCRVIGLGGIDKDTILPVVEHGWDGAALLGWIWKEPGVAVERYALIQKLIDTYRI
jgi:thiamine-phosphate pyrophosphorylase